MSDKKYEEITLQIHSDAKMALGGWTPWHWSPEKTYPETLETRVDVKFRDGSVHHEVRVFIYHDESPELSNWFNTHAADDPNGDDIVAYRLAK